MPADIVYWKLGYGGDHCGVLSNDRNADGLPLVIHNLGGARQEDCLGAWQITGHFRYPAGMTNGRSQKHPQNIAVSISHLALPAVL